MEDELNMRRAEVVALRNYYQKTSEAVSVLEQTLKLVRNKQYINERELKALNTLLESKK